MYCAVFNSQKNQVEYKDLGRNPPFLDHTTNLRNLLAKELIMLIRYRKESSCQIRGELDLTIKRIV